jgi:UDP-N-acetylmuramyl-tripeptide synthetase
MKEILAACGLSPSAADFSAGAQVHGVSADSRSVAAGSLFVCMPSARVDTHTFLPDVQASGAVAALVHSAEGLEQAMALGLDAALFPPEPTGIFRAAGLCAHHILGRPAEKLRVIGVTGTNGKTTTAWLVRGALERAGHKCAYLGTLGFQAGPDLRELSNTTPFPVETALLFAEAVAAGCTHLAMEVSSHALHEERVAGVVFDSAVFTNLTQDHLDYHGTMEAYGEAKRRLFTDWAAASRSAGKDWRGAVNSDDPTGAAWAGDGLLTFGSSGQLKITAKHVGVDRIELEAALEGQTAPVQMSLGGLFNVENGGAALAALIGLGMSLHDAAEAMNGSLAVPGRFEPVPNDLGFGVLVDYAHTPDALAKLISSVRALEPRRIITVFGCGGDRDRTKRPLMARAASEASDETIVTSDNPRTEDPLAILRDVEEGLVPGKPSVSIADRREAIFEAVRRAEQGDVVIIAGKGHEDYQIIGRVKHPMDDRLMAREALAAR